MIDDFLALDSEEGAAKVLFEKILNECLENKDFVKQYDRLNHKNMTNILKEMKEGNADKKAMREFRKFSEFVREYVFERLLTPVNKH